METRSNDAAVTVVIQSTGEAGQAIAGLPPLSGGCNEESPGSKGQEAG